MSTTVSAISPPTVMLWDPQTEAFSPRSPGPPTIASPTSPSFPPRHSEASRTRRTLSNPESLVDFTGFLKQLDQASREMQDIEAHPGDAVATESSPGTLDRHQGIKKNSPSHGPTTSTAKSGKNPLKLVWKEVLGQGGNHKTNASKEGLVLPYGRGGVARTRLATKSSPPVVIDPYVGTPRSPISYPPTNLSPSTMPHQQPPKHRYDPYYMAGSADGGYFHHIGDLDTRTKPTLREDSIPFQQPGEPTARQTEDVRHARYFTRSRSPSPSPSSDRSSLDNIIEETRRRERYSSKLRSGSIPAAAPQLSELTLNRPRSRSLTGAPRPQPPTVTIPVRAPGAPGVWLHPAQAALEASRAVEVVQQANSKAKRVSGEFGLKRRNTVASVCDMGDDDARSSIIHVELDQFPMPPSHVAPQPPPFLRGRYYSEEASFNRPSGVPTSGNRSLNIPQGPPPSVSYPARLSRKTSLPTIPPPLTLQSHSNLGNDIFGSYPLIHPMSPSTNIRRLDRTKIPPMPPAPQIPLPRPPISPITPGLAQLPGIHPAYSPIVELPRRGSSNSEGPHQHTSDGQLASPPFTRASAGSLGVQHTSVSSDSANMRNLQFSNAFPASLPSSPLVPGLTYLSSGLVTPEQVALEMEREALAREREMLEENLRTLTRLADLLEDRALIGRGKSVPPTLLPLEGTDLHPKITSSPSIGGAGHIGGKRLFNPDLDAVLEIESRAASRSSIFSDGEASTYLPYAQ